MISTFVTRLKQLAILISLVWLSACANLQTTGLSDASLLQSDQVDIKPLNIEKGLFGKDSYHLLVAEMAISRGQTDIAVT
eukprot:UN09055